MRRLAAAVGGSVLASLLVTSIAVAAPTSPFTGTWTSIDPIDGSIQHLYVRGGDSVQIYYVDEYATTCADIGAKTVVFTGVMTGRVSGYELNGWWKAAGCGSALVLKAAYRFAWTFEYDPDTDTLWGAIDDGPATWYRE